MSRNSIFPAIAAALLVPMLALAGSPEQNAKVIDKFIASIEADEQLDAAKREEVVKAVKELRDDEYSRTLAITEGLRETNPEFKTALELLGGEDLTPAITALEKLSKLTDPFLSSEATFYLAQAYTFDEKFEDAIPLLTNLIEKKADQTVQTGDATFLLGVSQARTLRRKEAIKSLTKFQEENPNAPERMRIAAWRQCEQLKYLEAGSLADVFDRMDFSRRHLNLTKSGDRTQEEQDKIIAMLTELIKEAEDRECNCSGSGQGQGQQQESQQSEGEGQKDGKGGGSKNPNRKVVRTFNNGQNSPWSKLRDRQRDPAFSAVKEKFPARYRKLIEQYYKSFQNEGE